MPDTKFDLGDYVQVKDRIAKFYELFGQGRLVTGEIRLTTEPDGVPRVLVQAFAYRTPDDPLPGVGWSWMPLPGKTSYTRDSELENVETSAWGRAIGALGILIDKSIASANEVQNKAGDAPQQGAGAPVQPPTPDVETEELVGDLKRAGMVKNGEAAGYKLEPRQGPDGHVIGFRLEIDSEKAIPQVVVEGPAGEALYLATSMNPAALLNERVTVKGRLFAVKRPGRRLYHRLHVTEWETRDYSYPAEDEPPADIHLVGESAPLFDDIPA